MSKNKPNLFNFIQSVAVMCLLSFLVGKETDLIINIIIGVVLALTIVTNIIMTNGVLNEGAIQ